MPLMVIKITSHELNHNIIYHVYKSDKLYYLKVLSSNVSIDSDFLLKV